MAKFSVGQYLVGINDPDGSKYGIIQVTAVDEYTYTYQIITDTVDPSLVGTFQTAAQWLIDTTFTNYNPSGAPTPYSSIIGLEMLIPMPPGAGPPLPQGLHIYWPWYKGVKGPPWE